MQTQPARRTAIAAAAVAVVVACGSDPATTSSPAPSTSTVLDPSPTSTAVVASTVAPGSSRAPDGEPSRPIGVVDVFVPTGSAGERPLAVIVPGGGWVDADPAGLVSLGQALADAGMVAVTTTYRASSDGAHFPVPAADVACSIASAGEASRAAGFPPGEVVLVGHSAGAQLAALVALRPEDFTGDCGSPALVPDRFVGLAGPYDVARARGAAIELFGPDNPNPTNWDDGNPVAHADRRPELDVLLAHGTADDVVPIFFTVDFADALRAGAHDVEEVHLDGVDHHVIYSAETAAPVILTWLES